MTEGQGESHRVPSFLGMPRTRRGWWSVSLVLAFVALMALLQVYVRAVRIPRPTFFSDPLSAALLLGAAGAGIAGGIVGILAILRNRERSFTIVLSVVVGALVLWFSIGECAWFGGRERPIPADKRAFIGTWHASSGFTLAIDSAGFARVVQSLRPNLPDSANLSIRVAPPLIPHIQVRFLSDSTLELITPGLYARVYRITRAPYVADGRWHLVLDGVVLDRGP